MYHIECIDKWLLRNNRFCPVCKRRVLPGGSDSESESGNQNTTAENQPNEDDDTNESSRLLVNVRIADDNTSTLTIQNNVNNNNDSSSLNNQIVTSATISRELNRSASSRYGSISSTSLMPNQTTSNQTEDAADEMFASYEAGESEEDSDRTVEARPKREKDSKTSPDFLSAMSSSAASSVVTSSIATENEENYSKNRLSQKKKTEVKKAKSSQINAQNINKIVEKLGDKVSELIKSEKRAESSDEEVLLPCSSSNNADYQSANPEISDDQP